MNSSIVFWRMHKFLQLWIGNFFLNLDNDDDHVTWDEEFDIPEVILITTE